MASTTVAQLATELNRSAATLLEQMQSAGLSKASTDARITEADKERLLEYLRSTHGIASGSERKKITLTRKSTSEIKQADASGKARTIQVEVRKKRTFVKRDEASGVPAEPAVPVIDDAELAHREQEAQAQAALLRTQEEDLAQQRREREESEWREREAAALLEREAAAKAAAEAAAAVAAVLAAAPPAAPPKTTRGKKAAALAPPPVAAPVPPAEPVKPVLRVIKAADVENEDKQRAADLTKRRKAAEDEAVAIRAMMSAPKRVPGKKLEEPKPLADAGKDGIKGTIHKKAAAPGAAPAAPSATARPGDKKSVKSEKLSSSWADDAAKKRALKPRGATGSAGSGRSGWRAPRAGRRGERNDGAAISHVAPAEQVTQEVHVPETISVADLAHKITFVGGVSC